MKESFVNQEVKPEWYENDQPIQEYLDSHRKHGSDKEDHPVQKPSWLKIMKKSLPK